MALYSYKNLFVRTILLWGISQTKRSEYKYTYDNNETCIDVKMDVLFTLSNGMEEVTFDGNNFTVKSGDCAKFGEYQAALTLANSNEDFLSFTFNINPDLSVNMSSMFTFAPTEFFPGTPISTSINLLDTGDMKLGSDTQLYQCNANQIVTLTGALEGTTYTMFMDMSSVQIQAFNIKNGKLSTDMFVCSADQMTTVAQETTVTSEPAKPTTEPSASNVTTVGPSNTTTVGPSNMTTKQTPVPTSSPNPSFPPKSRYEVIENFKVCLILEGRFQLKVTYMTKENKSASVIVDIPESSDVTVMGACANGNDTKSILTITPIDEEILSLTFNYEIMNGTSNLVSWTAEVNLTKFPDARESELNHTVSGNPVELSSPKLFYKCEKGGSFSDDSEVLVFMFKEFKVQAFNVEDGRFSENGYDCKEDLGPIPDPENPPMHVFAIKRDNITCIVFKAKIKFNIPYLSNNGVVTKQISLPKNYTLSGDCNTTLNGYYSQKMVINFYNTWEMSMFFTSDVQQSEFWRGYTYRVTKYHISQIQLLYDFDNNLFTDAVDSIVGKNTEAFATNRRLLPTDEDKSYMCNKESTFNIQNGLSMITKELQFQAFKNEYTTAFSAEVECGEEEETYVLLISTGAALGGLLLLVIVAVIVQRKRKRYEQLTY
ncbi:uncharacterized protein LOC134257513 isoform X1 [Saccostrea cucullata]|uniref:uncharacterized protein LOC134257513 isoform X1 n=1 Tax=Saccostrea cuccullata TaxID=36930 RepID=UPI002ED596FA